MIKLILNPAAGRVSPEKHWPEIKKALDEAGLRYEIERTEKRGHATEIAKKAVSDRFDHVIAIGGDGTANEVVNGLIGSDVVMGVMPYGEGNDFCKILGFAPGDVKGVIRSLKEGRVKKIDVGEVNGRAFVNMCGIGLDAQIAGFKEEMSHFLKGILVYAFNLPLILMTFRPIDMEVSIDGLVSKDPIALIGIGNGRYEGGIFKLTPDAELDDGLLDICIAKYPGRFRALWAALISIWGKHVGLPYISMLKAKKLEIKAEKKMPAHLDGEIMSSERFEIKILPGKLNILAGKK